MQVSLEMKEAALIQVSKLRLVDGNNEPAVVWYMAVFRRNSISNGKSICSICKNEIRSKHLLVVEDPAERLTDNEHEAIRGMTQKGWVAPGN